MSETESSLVRASKISLIVVGGIAVFIAVAKTMLFPAPPIPLDHVNGHYSNALCGTLTFYNGRLRFEKSEILYSLETDKKGLYALTKGFVGIDNSGSRCRIVFERTQSALYLRFDDEIHPENVSLIEVEPYATFDFSRQ